MAIPALPRGVAPDAWRRSWRRLSVATWLGCSACCFQPVGAGGTSGTSGGPTGPSRALGACESPGEAQPSGADFCGSVDDCAHNVPRDAGCPSLICPNCSSAEGTSLSDQEYTCARAIGRCGNTFYECLLDAGSLSPPCSKGLQELVAGLMTPDGGR